MGLTVSCFEQFFVQGKHGERFRTLHPLLHLTGYGVIIICVFLIWLHIGEFAMGSRDHLRVAYGNLPVTLPSVFVISVVGILIVRLVGFIGARKVFYLLIGRYYRPALEKKVFMFIDIKDSTRIVERIGSLKAKALIGKFLFDVSRPITDHKGEIYVYTGDGLIAMWDWANAFRNANVLHAVRGIFDKTRDEAPVYEEAFGITPQFRVGLHGGEVVISEQGDVKRAIGVYGDPINIAARMEQKAKELKQVVILSSEIVENAGDSGFDFDYLGEETIKGITGPIKVYTVRGIRQ